MKSITHLFLSLALVLSFIACQPAIDKKMLVGEWKGAQWLIEGQTADYDASSTFFSFQDGGTYTYRYTDMEEKGTYYLNANELFTTPDGGVKMMVKIEKLTSDSLVMNMNRGGTSETLTLIR
jgi:Lipocalin-like domain